jgi:hypothetical protein
MSDEDGGAAWFLAALGEGLEAGERMILCGFEGDPNAAPPEAWRPRPWRPGARTGLGRDDNAYVAVSSFGRAADGTWRRRVDCFAAGLALMVDDVGTKVSRESMRTVEPTVRIETSPDNEQWWFFLREPLRDVSRFDAIIRAFIAGNLLGADPGMSGVNRVGRLPGFVNGKAKYRGFRTRVLAADYARRFDPDDLVQRFGLQLNGRRYVESKPRGSPELIERVRAFEQFAAQMREAGLFKRSEFDPSGWIEVRCPWVGDHTGVADTGAAIRRPSDENGWYGAFRCHHGHCAARGWPELTDWLTEMNEGVMN